MEPEPPEIIAKNIEHFTGRTWLLSPLLEWYSQSKKRMFILTGSPGTGKSMIIAWLAGLGPLATDTHARLQLEQIRSQVGAVHFCRFAFGDSVDPKNFAEKLADQLATNIKGFKEALIATLPEKIKIYIKQDIEKVESGGKVTGVNIEKLVLNLGGEESFNRLLRDPLKKLYQEGYSKPIILLVDALDEAMSYTGSINIVQLLTKLADLPEPVRFIVTVRPDPGVLYLLHEFKPFDLIVNAPDNVDDVGLYAYKRLVGLNDEQRSRLAARISKAAEGNFLYVYFVLKDLIPSLPSIPDLESMTLPEGLTGLYHDFLNREIGANRRRWFNSIKPVLGVIAVALGEGLNLIQIKGIAGQEVEESLEACKQYLDGDWPHGPFRLFHKSFADFLLEDKGNIAYHIDAANMHCLIATYYQKHYHSDWEQLDEYGIQYLLRQLLQCDTDKRLDSINLDEYAIRHLFSHMKAAGLHNLIGEVVNLYLELR